LTVSGDPSHDHSENIDLATIHKAPGAQTSDDGMASSIDRVFWHINTAVHDAEHEEVVLNRDMVVDGFLGTDGLHERNATFGSCHRPGQLGVGPSAGLEGS